MVYINERIVVNRALKKIPSNLRVVRVGSNSFQGISYAGKPQVVSRYILSNLWVKWRVEEMTSHQNLFLTGGGFYEAVHVTGNLHHDQETGQAAARCDPFLFNDVPA